MSVSQIQQESIASSPLLYLQETIGEYLVFGELSVGTVWAQLVRRGHSLKVIGLAPGFGIEESKCYWT